MQLSCSLDNSSLWPGCHILDKDFVSLSVLSEINYLGREGLVWLMALEVSVLGHLTLLFLGWCVVRQKPNVSESTV